MSMRMRLLVPAAVTAGLLLASGPVLAARLISTTLTGQVTAVSGGYVTIDGKSYQIAPGSAAASAISTVTVGENVDVTFDGPVTSSDSHIVTISPHSGS